jgi:hypothetical protein
MSVSLHWSCTVASVEILRLILMHIHASTQDNVKCACGWTKKELRAMPYKTRYGPYHMIPGVVVVCSPTENALEKLTQKRGLFTNK